VFQLLELSVIYDIVPAVDFTRPVPFNAFCLALNVFQSVELKYPFVRAPDWEILITFDNILSGAVALVILLL